MVLYSSFSLQLQIFYQLSRTRLANLIWSDRILVGYIEQYTVLYSLFYVFLFVSYMYVVHNEQTCNHLIPISSSHLILHLVSIYAWTGGFIETYWFRTY